MIKTRKCILHSTLSVIFFSLNMNGLPSIVQKNSNRIKLYTDSPKTESMGWGNCDSSTNGEDLIIKYFIQANDVVVDAGAYTGEWSTLVLEQTHEKCDLYAFEPVSDSFKKLNELSGKIHCYNMGLGKDEKKEYINFFYERGGNCSTLYERPILHDVPVRKLEVEITYLDKFCSSHNISHINFLKIDTEGCEWDVLQGTNDLISNRKIDIIQFEYGGTYTDASITLYQVYTYLKSKGYSVFKIVPDGLIHIPIWRDGLENYVYSNFLAILE